MRTYKNLWDKFISDKNIYEAITNVCKHKTNRRKFRDLHDNPEKYVEWIKREAMDFHNSHHTPLEIYDGISRKKRTIVVPSFREQIIHHMVVNILKPIIMKPLYEHSYGSIPGRGSHKAMKHIRKVIRNGKDIKYVLKMDIRKYFDSIPHDVLKAKISKTIKDERFLNLLFTIIDVTDKGIPLGFYTSQWIANWYLSDLDHYIKEDLRAKHYYRYMDDMVIFGSNKRKLHDMRRSIEAELNKIGLEMKGNYQVFRFERGGRFRFLDFMGFRFYRNRVTLRRSIFYRATRKAKAMSKKDKPTLFDIRQMMSYYGWLSCTDTYDAYMVWIAPYVNKAKMRKKLSNYDRRNNYELDYSSRNTGNKAA